MAGNSPQGTLSNYANVSNAVMFIGRASILCFCGGICLNCVFAIAKIACQLASLKSGGKWER